VTPNTNGTFRNDFASLTVNDLAISMVVERAAAFLCSVCVSALFDLRWYSVTLCSGRESNYSSISFSVRPTDRYKLEAGDVQPAGHLTSFSRVLVAADVLLALRL
jgi:hypothetical protein